MARPGIAACLLAACYSPSPSPGAPCASGDTCPSGLLCVAGSCQLGPGEVDAASDGRPPIDAPVDPAIDGSIDLTWSMPVKVPGVNSTSAEQDPSMSADQLTIVFASNRAGAGNYDIFLGARQTTADSFLVTAVTAINSDTVDDKSPEITADGKTLYFSSQRSGAGDIYRSTRGQNGWSAPVLVAELSSANASDGDLAISPDGLTVIVTRANQMYRATRATPASSFGALAVVPELDITADVAAPSIGGSGAVYFHAGTVRDLYVARPQGTGYTAAVPITELNTGSRDASPFVSADEKFLWFERAGEIYQATR